MDCEENHSLTDTHDNSMEMHEEKVERILPSKSKRLYLTAYENFMRWREEKQIISYSESVFLTYFGELSKKRKPLSLWSIYSMLKTTLQVKNEVNIKTYAKLTCYLKRLSIGQKSVKSRIFTAEQIETFLNTAPDERYLATKVALIFGISGACRCVELINITVDDVKLDAQLQAVILTDMRTNKEKTFMLKGEYLYIVKKYLALRPENIPTNRFFINYRDGKCTRQPIGKNKFTALPKQIAVFLKLQNPEKYTGHCFRRTSFALLAESRENRTSVLKRHCRCKSNQVADVNIKESIQQKAKTSDVITEGIKIVPEADSGANLTTVKQHGGFNDLKGQPKADQWRIEVNGNELERRTSTSNSRRICADEEKEGSCNTDQVTVTEVYIEEYMEQKPKITDFITEGINVPNEPGPSSANSTREKNLNNDDNDPFASKSPELDDIPDIPSQIQSSTTYNLPGKTITLNISNCTNVTFKFN